MSSDHVPFAARASMSWLMSAAAATRRDMRNSQNPWMSAALVLPAVIGVWLLVAAILFASGFGP